MVKPKKKGSLDAVTRLLNRSNLPVAHSFFAGLFFFFLSLAATGQTRAERMMLTVADIVQQLVQAHKEGKDVNLNKYIHQYRL